jgi:hypothetical protein
LRASFTQVRTASRILLALVAATLLTTSAFAADHPWIPRKARVTVFGLHAGTARGSWCSSRETGDGQGVHGCADYAYPLDTPSYLPITPGAAVRVDVRRAARDVTATLRRVDGNEITVVGSAMTGQPVDSKRRIWRLRLPLVVGGATALSITAHWQDSWGDANWWAGVRPVASWRFSRPPYDPADEQGWSPKRARVRSYGLSTATAIGEWCSKRHKQGDEYAVGCADKAYPLHPRTDVPITPGGVVLADVREPATRGVTARLKRVEGNQVTYVGPPVTATPVDSRKRVWRLRLPQQVAGATVLSIWADFEEPSFANFWAGVRPVSRWP